MIWFADFETSHTEDKKGSYVYLGYIESLEKETGNLFLNISELVDIIHASGNKRTHTVYFHNLSYDGEYLIWWLIENGFKPQLNKVSKSLEFKERTDIFGSRSEIYINYKQTRISFVCSYKVWPTALADIGESLGFEKGEINHELIRYYNNIDDVPKNEKDYVIRDVQIIKKKYIQYSKYYKIKKTASAGAWFNFKEWYQKEFSKQDFKYKYNFTKEDTDKFQQAYFGGLSIVNPEYVNKLIEELGTYWDVRSSYPSIFVDNLLPYGLPLNDKPDGKYVEMVEAIIHNIIKVDTKMPNHLHNWNKSSFKNETYIENHKSSLFVIYTVQEWEELKLTYNFDIITKKSIYFKADNSLGDYINHMYHLKENETDKVLRNDHKLVLNSFYGKWGQGYKYARKDLILKTSEDKLKYKYGDYVYNRSVEISEDYKYLPIALFITSLARVKLLQAVRQNKTRWIYGDTDSLIMLGNDKISGVEIDSKKIGCWNLELEFKKFKCLKTKRYILETSSGEFKKTLAGISKTAKDNINFDNFFIGSVIKNGNRKKRKVKGGYIILDEDTEL